MSQVTDVPANSQIPFGGDRKYFPSAIFYNRLGCERSCEFDSKIEDWLTDVKDYIDALPTNLKQINKSCLEVSASNAEVSNIIQQNNQKYCHRKAHINKHVQLSSFVNSLKDCQDFLPWWTHVHTIEYLQFVGMCCTPVSSWFVIDHILRHRRNHPPNQNLTEEMIAISIEIQGGIDRATGHRYTSSAGKVIPRTKLVKSLHNLNKLLLKSNTSNDTGDIVKCMSADVEKGGCYKMGDLSATEVLTIYHLSGWGTNPLHAVNAVINEKNNNTKFLEETYGFSRTQRDKLLKIAKICMPDVPTSVIENASCKMGLQQKHTTISRYDTVFENQKYIYTIESGKIIRYDKDGNKEIVPV